MGLDPVTISIAMAATSVASTAVSYSKSKKAAKEQKEQNRIGGAQQEVDAQKQREIQARQARIRRAQVLQAAQNTNVAGSSGEFGAVNYLTGEQGVGSSVLLNGKVTATALSRSAQKEADLLQSAGTAQQVAKISSSIATNPNATAAISDAGTKIKGAFK